MNKHGFVVTLCVQYQEPCGWTMRWMSTRLVRRKADDKDIHYLSNQRANICIFNLSKFRTSMCALVCLNEKIATLLLICLYFYKCKRTMKKSMIYDIKLIHIRNLSLTLFAMNDPNILNYACSMAKFCVINYIWTKYWCRWVVPKLVPFNMHVICIKPGINLYFTIKAITTTTSIHAVVLNLGQNHFDHYFCKTHPLKHKMCFLPFGNK